MNVKVSVIIPVFNVRPYLREALESVIGQTYRNLEIIIVDDGSTDGSELICDEYKKDPRVKVIHQENRGLSGARNTGLSVMTGEVVSFLDPDDAYCPDMIEKMLKRMKETQADLVSCNCLVFTTTGRMDQSKPVAASRYQEEVMTAAQTFNRMTRSQFTWSVWNKLYVRKLWDNVRYPEGRVYEDVLVMPLILEQCGTVAAMKDYLMRYRRRKGSITGTLTAKNLGDYLYAMNWIEEYVASHVPEPITEANGAFFQENNVRRVVDQCMDWMVKNPRNKALHEMRQSLLPKCKELQKSARERNTRMVFRLFIHCPLLIPPLRAVYRILKRIKKAIR